MSAAGRPTAAHEERVAFLQSLAALVGCVGGMQDALPDGTRPDVIRRAPGGRFLFVGDAKDSETPGCRETRRRLAGYMRWLRAHEAAGGTAVFAVCFGREAEAGRWLRAIRGLAASERVSCAAGGVEEFGPGLTVAWLATG